MVCVTYGASGLQDFQDTHMFTDVTERLSEIEDIVAMSRRAIVPKQAIIMGIWGSSKDRECINLLLPKLLEANVLDRPTVSTLPCPCGAPASHVSNACPLHQTATRWRRECVC